jgi:hypothetical protein
MVVHVFNPSTLGAEAGEIMSLRPASARYGDPVSKYNNISRSTLQASATTLMP